MPLYGILHFRCFWSQQDGSGKSLRLHKEYPSLWEGASTNIWHTVFSFFPRIPMDRSLWAVLFFIP